MINSGSGNNSKEKELIFDIAKKIEIEKKNLSVDEIFKLLSFCTEASTLICQRSKDPVEKEYYFNHIKLLNSIRKDFDGTLLQKYLRLILNTNQSSAAIVSPQKSIQKPPVESNKSNKNSNARFTYNDMEVDVWDDYDENLVKNLYIANNFTDSQGFLKLSDSLNTYFSTWKRPKDIFSSEKLSLKRDIIKPNQIKQTQVGDCSLISSFIILLNYEQKFNIFVISKYLVFPDCYNPAGKYAIRLFLDGKWCKVIIDDFLPISNFNSLLCSHTTTEGELYISLLEKAYLKYHYGYDFPGSTSSSDIWRLIRWIPEFIYISDADKSLLWKKMLTISKNGSGVMAAGTGSNTGKLLLAEEHCYAILDTMDIEIGGGKILKLMIMQNPWRKSEIQDKFSFKDYNSLPYKMKQILAEIKNGEDKGMFLIEFDRFCESFEDLHISWNPSKIFIPQNYNKEISRVEKMSNHLLNNSLKKNPQFLIYNVHFDLNHPNQIMWLLINHHLAKPLEPSKQVINIRIFLTVQDSVERIDKSYYPDKIFPLDTIKYYKKQFSLAKLYLKEIYEKYKIAKMKFIIIVTYSDATENADFEALISYSLYIYSNVQFDLGEIQYTAKDYEFHDNFAIDNNEGFTNFDSSSQFYIDFGEIGKHINQTLTIEIESSTFELKAALAINNLKRDSINQRISEEMMSEIGLQLNPLEKKLNKSLLIQEYSFSDIEKVNLIIYSENYSSPIDFSVKIISKNDIKCFKLKKIHEFLPKLLKIKNSLTPNNYNRQIGPTYIIIIEKELQILMKSTNKILLALYQFPYRNFLPDFSDLPYNNFNFSNPMVQTYSHTNEIVNLTRGTYFLRVENFLNNNVYNNLAGSYLFYIYLSNSNIKIDRFI